VLQATVSAEMSFVWTAPSGHSQIFGANRKQPLKPRSHVDAIKPVTFVSP
jgi:hypothetical protein